ncbi:YhcN/YlaJ family sporulation lipoprotein [Clostridiaceae bacterium M8S5]|nr:YhcN/YlaJ family sporulation lipoprotein [Clostridiaceae bacterium M8S5]
MFKRISLLLLVFVLMFTLAVGCEKKAKDEEKDSNTTQENNTNNETSDIGYKSGTNLAGNYGNYMRNRMLNENTMEMQIANNVQRLPEVNNAVCLVNNKNEAVVGVNCKGIPSGTIPSNIQSKIKSEIKKANPNVKNIIITSDDEMYSKIGNLSNRINQTTNTIRTDLDKIMNSMRNRMR